MHTDRIESISQSRPFPIAGRRGILFLVGISLAGLLSIGRQALAQGTALTWTAANNTTWDTSTANWSDGPEVYSDGDIAVFSDPVPAGGAVVIAPGGVNPGEVQVSNNSGTYTITGGPIGGDGDLEKNGSGTLILGSSNSYSGGTTISGGTLTAEAGDSALGAPAEPVTLDGGVLAIQNTAFVSSRDFILDDAGGSIDTGGIDSSTSGSVIGPGLLTKTGLGDFTISGALEGAGISVAAGSVTINEPGPQYVTAPSTPGDFAGDFNLGGGISLEITGGASASAPVLINGGGAVHFLGSGSSVIANGAVEIDNNIVLNSEAAGEPFSTAFSASLSSQLTISGTLSGDSDVSFVSTGRGSPLILLNAPATYTGNTSLAYAFGGVLRLGANNALPVSTQLAFSEGAGALDLNGFNQTVAALSDGGYDNGITNTGSGISTLTVNQNVDTTYASSIGTPTVTGPNLSGPNLNNINLVKEGTGLLRLTGNETYTGSTSVSGGTLVVSGGISGSLGGITNTSGVSVTNGATLAGQGVVSVAPGGQVVIGSGATVAPGDSGAFPPTGLLTISDPGTAPASGGTFDLQTGGKLFVSLDAFEAGGSQDPGNSAGGWDSQLAVAGNITLAGTLSGTLLSGFTANPGDLFFIIVNQGTNPVNGTFAGNPSTITLTGAGESVTFNIGYNGNAAANTFTGGNDVVLEVSAIPEPGSNEICLAGLGLLAIRLSVRRRSR